MAGGAQGQDGGLGTAVIVPRGERKTTLFTEKARPLLLASSRPGGDRGPLLGKQEARISRTQRATRRPLAPASANSQKLLPATSCLSVHPLVICPSDHEAQVSGFGAKLLSMLNPAVGGGVSTGGCSLLVEPPGHIGTNTR